MNPDDLLEQPVFHVAARRIELQIEAAREALGRMRDRKDGEALHDFRVAIRRLRSVLRAYRRWLGRAAGRKLRRRFSELAAATNGGRDAEVQIAWLERQRASLSRSERSGLNWILRRRRAARRAGWDDARRHGRDDFELLSAKLLDRLGRSADATPALRDVYGGLVRRHADALGDALAAIRDAGDQSCVHAARIRAKRLRYLLEPLRAESSAVKQLIRPLKDLQDVLGDLHDLHVLDAQLCTDLDAVSIAKAHRLRELALAEDAAALARERRRDERLGLVALGARVRAARDGLYAKFETTWRSERLATLLAGAAALADSLAPAERQDAPDAPPLERERKFLLRSFPDAARSAPVREIEQGWLPGERLHERLRRVRDAAGERFYRTVKLGRGIERIEIEEETTPEVFRTMWPLTEGCRIRKRRYDVREGDLLWEVDEFTDRDLVLAEVELDTVDQDVPIPSWIEDVLVREVTDEPAYLNLSLAKQAG